MAGEPTKEDMELGEQMIKDGEGLVEHAKTEPKNSSGMNMAGRYTSHGERLVERGEKLRSGFFK